MALILWPLLLSIPIPFVWAGPPSTASLTPYLADVVPTCAQRCLLSFIADNYPVQVCTAQNFNCLCINPTTSGYTIGEGALTCLASACSSQEQAHSVNVYEVCKTINGAQPNTHPTLTASYDPSSADNVEQTVSTTFPTSTPTKRTMVSSVASSPLATSNTASGIDKIKATTTESTSSSSTTSSNLIRPTSSKSATNVATSPASTSSVAAVPAALTKPQIAGVIVASVGAAAVVFGLCFLLLCCRRRKAHRRRHSDTSFVGDKMVGSQESSPDMSATETRDFATDDEPRAKSPPRAPLTIVTAPQTNHEGWQNWAKSTNPSPRNIGLALVPELPHSAKEGPLPMTPGSYSINSQLLPERPTTYSLFPAPPRSGPDSRRTSQNLKPPIPAYAPERASKMNGPRFPSSVDTSQANLQGDGRQRSLSDPFYDAPKSSPLQGYRGIPFTDPSAAVMRPTQAYHPYEPQDMGPASASPRTQQPSLPRTYPPPPPIEQHYLASIERSNSRKHPSRKKSANSSQFTRSTRFSNGSETSFEDADADDFPLPRSELSTVAEVRSPPQKSPKVIYPPVPYTAAESSNRIINRPRPPYRKESLVAKRRGEEKAAELAEGLQGRDVRQTAKWKILVSPGLESLDGSSSGSPYTARSAGRTPPMRPARSPPIQR